MAPSSETYAFPVCVPFDKNDMIPIWFQSSREIYKYYEEGHATWQGQPNFSFFPNAMNGRRPELGFYSIRQFLLKLTEDLYTRKNYPSLYGGDIIISPHPTQKSSKQCQQEFLADQESKNNFFARNGNP